MQKRGDFRANYRIFRDSVLILLEERALKARSPFPESVLFAVSRTLILCLLLTALAPLLRAEALQHCLLFKFKDDASREEVSEVLADLDELPARIPGIVNMQWGLNNSPENLNQGLTHGLIMTFESPEAFEKYVPHPVHQEFAGRILPLLEELFVFDFTVPEPPEPAEPGRVHHMVFFKYKDSATEEQIEEIQSEFAALEKKIPGLLEFQSGQQTSDVEQTKGFTHAYVLTFIHNRARNDYLIHPAHKEFVTLVGPVLEEPLVLDFTVVPSSRSLFVVDGLEPYAVYQRDAEGVADLKFSGISRDDGSIEARLRAGRRTVPGFDWRKVGMAAAGTFEAVLEDVPTGGEYTVEVRRRDLLGNVADHTEVANILVGDLWILAGQSNMQGVGNLADVEKPSPLVHCYTMAHRWELATEPLHWLIDSPDPVHSGQRLEGLDEEGRRARRSAERANRTKGAGLGLPFAKELVRRTGVPIGLIASAHGGTSMQQWDPEGRDAGGETLYGSMYKQVENAGGSVKGVLWYQGESDANPDAVPLFAERFKQLVAAFRKDFDDPDLPFFYVQIGRFVRSGDSESWDRIQELQRLAEKEIPGTAMIAVIDLPLDDLIHVGTPGLKRAGKRLARIAHKELYGAEGLERGPRLESVKLEQGRRLIRVEYSRVNGQLSPKRKVEGFSLEDKEGNELKLIYNASVDPADPDTVVLKLQNAAPEGATLWYGAGLDPVCNLVDSEDMAAPVFGPLKLPAE